MMKTHSRATTLLVLGGLAAAAGLWATAANAEPIAAAPFSAGAVFSGHGQTLTQSDAGFAMAMTAPGVGGTCYDASSALTLGTACSMSLETEVWATKVTPCVGTGTGTFTLRPSVGYPTYEFLGTTTVHHTTGTFNGVYTDVAGEKVASAHIVYTTSAVPCGGSAQSPNRTQVTFAGSFKYLNP